MISFFCSCPLTFLYQFSCCFSAFSFTAGVPDPRHVAGLSGSFGSPETGFDGRFSRGLGTRLKSLALPLHKSHHEKAAAKQDKHDKRNDEPAMSSTSSYPESEELSTISVCTYFLDSIHILSIFACMPMIAQESGCATVAVT